MSVSVLGKARGAGLALFFSAAFLGFSEPGRAADEFIYGPRLEIGGGVGYLAEQSNPGWGADAFYQMIISGSYRIYRGLYLQGGFDYSRGIENPEVKSITLGDYQVPLNERSIRNSSSAGIKYEVPAFGFLKRMAGLYSVYGATGMMWADYHVASTTWSSPTEFNRDKVQRAFRTVDLSGPYFTLAGRWRIDNTNPEQENSWIGAYGIDFGARYTRYSDKSLKYSSLGELSSGFSGTQIFLMGFVKFELFE